MPLHLEAVQRLEKLGVSLEYRNALARTASLANSARVRTLVLIIGPAILLILGAGFPYLMIVALLRARHREREEADRARRATSLVGIAAHELRNHLNSLLLNVESILARVKRDAGSANIGERALQRLREQAATLSHLLSGLLDVAQLSSDQIRLEPVSLDLGEVARETISQHQDEIGASGSIVTLTIESPAIGLWDHVRVEQIVTNLLSNAIKYGRGNPVEVSVGSAEGSAWLSVRDHGIGISPADQSRIFQQYERAIGARQFRGTGLGLWVCQRLVAAMHGEIRLWSELGKGSQFTVTLPLHPPHARAQSTSGRIEGSVPS
jgi:signal transduction histidine kinase